MNKFIDSMAEIIINSLIDIIPYTNIYTKPTKIIKLKETYINIQNKIKNRWSNNIDDFYLYELRLSLHEDRVSFINCNINIYYADPKFIELLIEQVIIQLNKNI